MDETVSVAVTGDVSGLEAAMEKAVEAIDAAAGEIEASFSRASEMHIAGEQRANVFLLQMGEETLDRFAAQAGKLEDERAAAELAGLKKRETDNASSKAQLAKDMADEETLYQAHANRLAAIDEDTARRKRESDEKAFADFEKSQQNAVKAALDANAGKTNSGDIDTDQLAQMDMAALQSAKSAVDQQFDALTAGWDRESLAYKAELDKRAGFDQWYAEEKKRIDDQAAQDDARSWQQANNAVLGAEDGLVRDLLTKRQSLGVDMLQMAGHFLERELAADLKYWTERGLLAIEGVDSEKTAEQSGVLMHGLMSLLKTDTTQTSQTTQTAATVAGVAARTSAEKAGQSAGLLAQVEAGSKAVMNDAYQAAAATWAAVAQIPVIGPFLAPPAAAAAFAGVMAFDALTALDVGAWEIPQNMPAILHKGEMVVPQNFASGLRGAGGSITGGDTNFHTTYAPTINTAASPSLKQLLQGSANELVDAINRGYRTGLPIRPSMATW
jgi:hypothetical protein